MRYVAAAAVLLCLAGQAPPASAGEVVPFGRLAPLARKARAQLTTLRPVLEAARTSAQVRSQQLYYKAHDVRRTRYYGALRHAVEILALDALPTHSFLGVTELKVEPHGDLGFVQHMVEKRILAPWREDMKGFFWESDPARVERELFGATDLADGTRTRILLNGRGMIVRPLGLFETLLAPGRIELQLTDGQKRYSVVAEELSRHRFRVEAAEQQQRGEDWTDVRRVRGLELAVVTDDDRGPEADTARRAQWEQALEQTQLGLFMKLRERTGGDTDALRAAFSDEVQAINAHAELRRIQSNAQALFGTPRQRQASALIGEHSLVTAEDVIAAAPRLLQGELDRPGSEAAQRLGALDHQAAQRLERWLAESPQ